MPRVSAASPFSGAPLVAPLVKNLSAMPKTLVRFLGLGRSPGDGNGYPLQYSGLENSMDCVAHGVAKSWTRLRDFSKKKYEATANYLKHKNQLFERLPQ